MTLSITGSLARGEACCRLPGRLGGVSGASMVSVTDGDVQSVVRFVLLP